MPDEKPIEAEWQRFENYYAASLMALHLSGEAAGQRLTPEIVKTVSSTMRMGFYAGVAAVLKIMHSNDPDDMPIVFDRILHELTGRERG